MKPRLVLAACAMIPCMAWAQALAVRTGGWEFTHKSTLDGKVETTVVKSCVKKSSLESADTFAKPGKGCTQDIKSRTSTHWSLTSTCSEGGLQSKSDIEITVTSHESVLAKVVSQIVVGGKTQNLRLETSGRWRSASCAGYDDDEE